MPDRSNKITILDAMANTFPMRNLERKDNKSVFYFMEKYPHFGSFEGEIVSIPIFQSCKLLLLLLR